MVHRENHYFAHDEPVQIIPTYLRWDEAQGTLLMQAKTGKDGIYGRLQDLGHVMTRVRDGPLWIGLEDMRRAPDDFGSRSQTMPPAGDRPAPGWGAPFEAAGTSRWAWWASIPSTVDPGRAEQTRPMASRSFVQWWAETGLLVWSCL